MRNGNRRSFKWTATRRSRPLNQEPYKTTAESKLVSVNHYMDADRTFFKCSKYSACVRWTSLPNRSRQVLQCTQGTGYPTHYLRTLQGRVERTRIQKREIQNVLRMNVIEQTKSKLAPHILLVAKNEGSLQFLVDYRKLSADSVKNTYPIPGMVGCI